MALRFSLSRPIDKQSIDNSINQVSINYVIAMALSTTEGLFLCLKHLIDDFIKFLEFDYEAFRLKT